MRDGFVLFNHREALTTTQLAHTSSDAKAAAQQDATARRVHPLQTQRGPDDDATSSHLVDHKAAARQDTSARRVHPLQTQRVLTTTRLAHTPSDTEAAA